MSRNLPKLNQDDEDVPENRTSLADYAALAGGAPEPFQTPFLLVKTGSLAGTLARAQDGMVIGRAVSADLVLDSPSVSRRHAIVGVSATGEVTISDLESRNALAYEGERVTSCVLEEAKPLRIGEVVVTLVRLEDVDDRVRQNMIKAGSLDFMTGLLAPHALNRAFSHQFLSAARNGTPLSYVLIAIDQLNAEGELSRTDLALTRQVGIRIRRTVRTTEDAIFGRRGERQMVLVMPMVSPEAAVIAMDRCRAVVAKDPIIVDGVPRSLTISAGIAAEGLTAHDVMVKADEALAAARQRGGNCVTYRA